VVRLRPFQGVLYDPQRVDLSQVVAPPYDVISPADQKRYYQQDPHNVVRLIAGEVRPSDTPQDNKYTRAAAFFHDWLANGILRREAGPRLYVYRHQFVDPLSRQSRSRLGIMGVVELEPFGRRSLRRFILYEHPQEIAATRDLSSMLKAAAEDAEEIQFGSVGELYGLIESGFSNIDEKKLFIGAPTQQMTKDLFHFPDLVKVVDRASAIKAIEEITEQGEGTNRDRDDSHFGAFVAILEELLDSREQGSSFSPARPAMRNPSASLERGYGANANPIDAPLSGKVAGLFDSAYSLMLRMLAWSFEFDAAGVEEQLKDFCRIAIDLMPRVLLPLGEGLMLMPAGNKYPGKTAGPGFGLTRHVMLPPNAENARRLCQERFKELAALTDDIFKNDLPVAVKNGCRHLQEIAEGFQKR